MARQAAWSWWAPALPACSLRSSLHLCRSPWWRVRLWAQAGIAVALAEGDTPEAHAADTIRAGAGIVEEKIALLMAREARERIEDLLRYGVPFDKDLEGHWALGREAAHGRNRILHV